MDSVKISSGGFRMAFLAVGVAVLWNPTRWMVDNARMLHARRGVTPEILSGPAGPGVFCRPRR
jgi:hypothetical protein